MLHAGRLRHRVEIQKPVMVQDSDTGAMTPSWVTIATVWAGIEPLSVREFVAAESEHSKVSARIVMRYRDDINATMRLFHAKKNKYYDIQGILSDKDSGLEYLTIPVSEGLKYQEGDDVIPVNISVPVITGNAIVGQTLSASTGQWANDPVGFAYQWYKNGVAISPGGNTSNLVVPNNIGDTITVRVIANNSAGDSTQAVSLGKIIS